MQERSLWERGAQLLYDVNIDLKLRIPPKFCLGYRHVSIREDTGPLQRAMALTGALMRVAKAIEEAGNPRLANMHAQIEAVLKEMKVK